MQFTAWRYRHFWNGNNVLIGTHVFYRLIRQVATGGNIVTKGKFINFVECRGVESYEGSAEEEHYDNEQDDKDCIDYDSNDDSPSL